MQFSWKACRWIEHQSEWLSRHINHALCGHGGERAVRIDKKEILLDGHVPETSTIYQFLRMQVAGLSLPHRHAKTLLGEPKEPNPKFGI